MAKNYETFSSTIRDLVYYVLFRELRISVNTVNSGDAIYRYTQPSADVRTVGFVLSFRSCRAIQGGFLLLAMLVSYLVNDTWSLPSLSRSTKIMDFLIVFVQPAENN